MGVRILFICGTLEQGKSGVADYVITLAKELTRQGATCSCISIHDYTSSFQAGTSIARLTIDGINLIKLSALLPWRAISNLLVAEARSFCPDWISLQYVPYAFQSKGFPFGLYNCLREVLPLAQLEIMAHELWINPKSSIKNWFISSAQRYLTLSLFRRLHPRVLHTSNHYYQKLLSASGFTTEQLPLFSNIPYAPAACLPKLTKSSWTFVIFGSIHRDWNPKQLLAQIELARKYYSVEICRFVAIGSIGDYGSKLWNSLKSLPYPHFDFTTLI
jgi:hypothetical protein